MNGLCGNLFRGQVTDAYERLRHQHPDWSTARLHQRSKVEAYLDQAQFVCEFPATPPPSLSPAIGITQP